jgi:hypothetical protein
MVPPAAAPRDADKVREKAELKRIATAPPVAAPRDADKVREKVELKRIATAPPVATPRATAETLGEGGLERPGTIYMALTPDAARDRLNSIASHFGNGTRILLAIDVDKTLIADGSDFKSQSECGNSSQMQVIDKLFLDTIFQLLENSHLPNHPVIKAVALTTACNRVLQAPQSQWPKVVVAIDDNLVMLENMRAIYTRRGIIFIGILLYRPIYAII